MEDTAFFGTFNGNGYVISNLHIRDNSCINGIYGGLFGRCNMTSGEPVQDPETGEYFYWENFGMMDDASYINKVCNKIRLYSINGIIPSINLITTYETKEHPLSIELVENIVNSYFG